MSCWKSCWLHQIATPSALNDAEKKQIVAIAEQYFSGEPDQDLARESLHRRTKF